MQYWSRRCRKWICDKMNSFPAGWDLLLMKRSFTGFFHNKVRWRSDPARNESGNRYLLEAILNEVTNISGKRRGDRLIIPQLLQIDRQTSRIAGWFSYEWSGPYRNACIEKELYPYLFQPKNHPMSSPAGWRETLVVESFDHEYKLFGKISKGYFPSTVDFPKRSRHPYR